MAQQFTNRLLRRLPDGILRQVGPQLKPVEFASRRIFNEANEYLTHAVFPDSGLLSAIIPSGQEVDVETCIIGQDGVYGAGDILAGQPAIHRIIAQVPGTGWLMEAGALREAFRSHEVFQRDIFIYLQFLMAQAGQCAVCNRLHTAQERLSRWLLTVADNTDQEGYILPAEYLACMLGTRLSAVPVALGILTQAGLIRTEGDHIAIMDREKLEKSSCACYRHMRRRLLDLRKDAPEPSLDAQAAIR